MKSNKFTNLLIAGSLSFGAIFSVSTPMSVNAATVNYNSVIPAYPQNFKADTTQTQVSLSWSKVTGATSYVLVKNGVKVYEGASYKFVDKKVTDNTAYTYVLYAKNAKGTSSGVILTAKTKAVPKPSSPANLKATASFNDVKLTWEKAANAVSYEVQRNGVKVYEGASTSFSDNGLIFNTSYSYTVIAKNKSGSSVAKVTAKTIGVPNALSGLKTVASFNEVKLSWNQSANASTYEVKRNGVKVYEGTLPSFTDKGLNTSTAYTYTVVAKNKAGNSASSSTTVKTLGTPESPVLQNIVPTSDSVTISWKAVSNASSYEVQKDGVKVYEGSKLSYFDTKVKADTPYIYTIIAKNQAGQSKAVSFATKTLKLEAPAKPSDFKASASTNKVSLTWSKVTKADSYEVFKNGVSVYKGANTSFVDTKVNEGTSYTYTVIAKNQAGHSAVAVATVKTGVDKPAQPTNVKVSAPFGQVSLSWNSSAKADSYEVFRNGVSVYKGAKTSFVDTKVKEGTSYTYTVVAKNKSGNSGATKSIVQTMTEKQHLINTIDSDYKGISVVDYLNSAKQSSSFASREKLAAKLGIKNYEGKASQNAEMLKMLRSDGK